MTTNECRTIPVMLLSLLISAAINHKTVSLKTLHGSKSDSFSYSNSSLMHHYYCQIEIKSLFSFHLTPITLIVILKQNMLNIGNREGNTKLSLVDGNQL
jgi:hypothetical protein